MCGFCVNHMNSGLYLICGDDEYLVDTTARAHVERLVPEADRTFGVERIDGHRELADDIVKAVEACIESVQTPGFLGTSKVTWLRDVTFLTGGGRISESKAVKGAVEKLSNLIKAGLRPDQRLIISTVRVLHTSIFYKACLKQGTVEDLGSGLKFWEADKCAVERLNRLLKKADISIDNEAQTEFIRRVGIDTRIIVQELEKLRLYIGTRKHASISDIHEITSFGREAEAWDLLNAFGERNALDVVKTLNRLSGPKKIGVMLASMLEKNVRELLVLRDAHARGWVIGGHGAPCSWSNTLPPEASILLSVLSIDPQKTNAWVLKKNLNYALNYSLQELRVARYRILSLREKLISTGLPEMFLLETTLLRIIGNKNIPLTRDSKK